MLKIGNFGIHIWGMQLSFQTSSVESEVPNCKKPKMMNNKFSINFFIHPHWFCFRKTCCSPFWCRKPSYLESAHEEWRSSSILILFTFDIFRFEELSSLKDGNLIVYVGANTDGADGVELMRKCPQWWEKLITGLQDLELDNNIYFKTFQHYSHFWASANI